MFFESLIYCRYQLSVDRRFRESTADDRVETSLWPEDIRIHRSGEPIAGIDCYQNIFAARRYLAGGLLHILTHLYLQMIG